MTSPITAPAATIAAGETGGPTDDPHHRASVIYRDMGERTLDRALELSVPTV